MESAMVSGDQKADKTQAQNIKKVATDRLSKALRDNLYRRKAQARARKSNDIKSIIADQPKGDGV